MGQALNAPKITEACTVSFAVLFLIFRSVYWPIVSYQFWRDSLGAYADGTMHSTSAMCTFLVANIGLTSLQFVWTRLILIGILEKVKLGAKEKQG